MTDHFADVRDIIDEKTTGEQDRILPDELRRDIWSSQVPGQSTEDKILEMLRFYNFSRYAADMMEREGNAREVAEIVSAWEAAPDDPPKPLHDLPIDAAVFIVGLVCHDCGEELYAIMTIGKGGLQGLEDDTPLVCPHCEREWIICPECGGYRVALSGYSPRNDMGL